MTQIIKAIMNSKILIIFVTICRMSEGHDEYYGDCPVFTPMKNFDMKKFQDGRWYATEKFDTSSKCLTYDFKTDDFGEMSVEQNSVLTGLRRFSIDNKVKYRGRLAAPYVSEPANMIVKFPLSILGTSSFVILDTDYDNYALVCTCQARKFFVDLLTFHRRSCTILQRSSERDSSISRQLHALLNEQIPSDAGDEKADHDFDIVSQTGCNYEDDGKGLQIDVDKILGSTQDEIGKTVVSAAETIEDFGEFFVDKSGKNEKEEATNLPVRKEKPRV